MIRRRRLSRLGRFRIRTLDVYVARQFLGAYIVFFFAFVGLYVLVEIFAKLDSFLRQESFFASLVRYHAAMIPTVYANFLGPILTLAAGMYTMTSLNRTNELTPLKAAGISVYRAMVPVFLFAALLAAFNFYLKDDVIPRFKEPIREALALSRSRPLNPSPYYDRDHGYWIKVLEYSTTRKLAQRVEISTLHPNGKIAVQIDASQMEWVPGPDGDNPEEGRWVLRQGSIQRWDEDGNLVVNAGATRFERLKELFRERELETTLRPIDLEASDIEISYLSWRDLRSQHVRQPYHRHLAVKLHHHFAFPLAHVILLFLGLPFVLNVSPKSGFVSLAMSFLICALFYFVSTVCMNVANQSELLTPNLAAWLPVMLFGALGITFFDRLPT